MWRINLYKDNKLVETLSFPSQAEQQNAALGVAAECHRTGKADSWWFTPSDWKGPKGSTLN